jgi:predicted CXXCH cytochrome family protein
MAQKGLQGRVVAAAEEALERQRFVSAIDVCIGLGWLHSRHVDNWRQGRADSIETFLPVPHSRIAEVTDHLQRWATGKGLTPSVAEYTSATRDRRQLRFTKDARPELEQAWRTHWLAADLPEKQQARIVERQKAVADLVVVQPVKDWTCAECHGEHDAGNLLIMDSGSPLCMTCADMDHLIFLPSGDAALTRRAKKESGLSAVVVRWSRSRKRYERQWLLVEEAALEVAEQQCLNDEDARMRRRDRDRERRAEQDLELQARFAKEIIRLYPGCPSDRAEAIAAHAALRGSGRVGRSAAGRSLDETAITLAVVASVRHENTDYDELLMSGVPREAARDQIRDTIDEVLESWSPG